MTIVLNAPFPAKVFHWEVIVSDQMEADRKHKTIRKSMNRSSQIYATKDQFKHNCHSIAC